MKKHRTRYSGKEVYKQLRTQSWDALWLQEVPLFNAGSSEYRIGRVGLVRALGVVALKQGSKQQRKQTREWLMRLLDDPEEKVRRYAIAALPKLGGKQKSEAALLSLLDHQNSTRELTYLSRALDKVGSEATLQKLAHISASNQSLHQTEQKIKAQLARNDSSTKVLLNVKIRDVRGLRIHLRTRWGMESFVRDELLAHSGLNERFKILRLSSGCVAISALGAFTLGELYQLRTFGSVSFVLGTINDSTDDVEELAKLIASKRTQRLCSKLTKGQPRYRLDFVRQQATSSKVQAVVSQAFKLCPDILNDARRAPWAVEIHAEKIGLSVELKPRVLPDPRFTYRVDDVPASTHPQLAAAMARMAGAESQDVVWDPFCGSGQELIERSLLGGVKTLIASDIDEKAVEIARLNLEAACHNNESLSFHCCDFIEYRNVTRIAPKSLSLIIANPPLGRRVRVDDLAGLMTRFYRVAAEALRPGGRLVFINPLKLDSPVPSLELQERHLVDLGGFNCRVEKWAKADL
jgi:23S rRNA G2445 N2-methylase RlmL